MSQTRVQISGYGFVTPMGESLEQFEQSLYKNTSAVQPLEVIVPGHHAFEVPVAPCVFDEKNYLTPSKLPADRATAMALKSLDQALNNAGIDLRDIEKDRVGVFWGSGMGGASSFDQTSQLIYGLNARIRPTCVVTGMPNAPASEIAIKTSAQGNCITYTCACASSSIAIGEGMKAVRAGMLDVAIVGGSESMLTPGMLMAWHGLRVLATVKNRQISNHVPFSKNRSGFAMGEGAAVFVLEKENQRVGKKYFLSGYSTNCDGHHMTHPQTSTQRKVMIACLNDAQLMANDLGYINAHATGTQIGDMTEATSIESVFGRANILVSSTKSLHGHLLGASGAIELLACISALENKMLPINSIEQEIDQDIHLNLVTAENKKISQLDHVMSNSFAFGGTNACLIVSK